MTCCGQGHGVPWSEPQRGAAERDPDGHSAVEGRERGLLTTHYPTLTSHPPRKRRPVEAAYADKGFLVAEVILPPLYNDLNGANTSTASLIASETGIFPESYGGSQSSSGSEMLSISIRVEPSCR